MSGRKPNRGSRLPAEPQHWRIVLGADALKQLNRLGRRDRERIERAIDRLPEGDVRQLSGEKAMWRLRVGAWRVRYRLNHDTRRVDVVAVQPRGSAYRP